MADIADIVLSAFLSVLFEKLASATLEKCAPYKEVDAEIKKWQRSLIQIQDVLADASHKEITSQAVKRWLNDLRHLAYEIDDVLDELATEAMHREFSEEAETHTSKVRKLIQICFKTFTRSTKIHDKFDIITTKLQELVEMKGALGLSVKEETRLKSDMNRRLQTSTFDASSIVGRQREKEALVDKLLDSESFRQNFSIVPIVGMGGIGKTTLARLLYDEKKVKDHFKVKAWVCVSDDFDSFAISSVIYESMTGENKVFTDLNLLQVASESWEDWDTLVGPFHACAPGSKIIMTTRKDTLLKKWGYNHVSQELQSLSDEDALSLIAQHALGSNNFDSHLSLKPHGEGIVKKCDGLPLALVALGRLLRSKNDEEDSWKEVLESEIWGLTDDVIFRALKLSYHDLSARLKQLFAYCSLFPKDFLFDRDELVLLWMAEGYLHPSTPRNLTAEQMGHEYFEELVSRSFFQHAPNNESLFVMHDLMNDLATFVASEFFIRLGNETEKTIRKEMLEKYLHMSFVRETYVTYKKFEAFTRAKSLRTFLATSVGEVNSWWHFYLSNKILVDLLFELPWIRVLCLSGFDIREVPESIGTLIHLRYLNLSRTRITHLPENVCSLYNLQTLIVFGCNELTKLPDNFFKLRNLRYLDIRDTPLLKKMPLGIGDLKNLQTLSKIIIEGESGLVITKLKDLENLCGKVSIMGLEKVENTIDARMAKFSQKKLSELEVVWSDEPYDLQNEMLEKEVLNEMKPRNEKLRKLKISSYGGLEFPIWVGEPSFLQLKHVSICGCKKCTSLPPLGQLPLLKELFVGGLERVKVVGMELLGNGCAFSSLETLIFFNMQGWEKWSTNIGVVFPCLRELHISECPNLIEVTLEALPSLNVLELYTCDSGVLRTLVQIASPITKLDIISISGLNDAVWRGVIEYLGAVEYIRIMRCNEIGYLWESELIASKVLVKLKELVVNQCDNLVSLGERVEEEDGCSRNLLTSLRVLYVRSCVKMVRCSFPDSIERLRVNSCHSITASPTIGQKLKSLELINCRQVLEREWGGQKIHNSGSTMLLLEYVWIVCWPNLKSVTELTYLVHLTTLRISNCANLESFPDNELSNMTSLKYLEITSCPRMDASFPCGVWPPNLCSLEIGKLKKPITEWGPQNQTILIWQ